MIRNIIRDVIRDAVVPIDGSSGVGAIELDLTSSASIEAWLTAYSGSYACSSVIWVKDNLGVYNEIPINKPAIYGARWDGSDFYNTDAGGDPITGGMGLAEWPQATNVVTSASYRDFTHAEWTAANGSVTAGNVVLIDGTTVADKNTLTASGANCTLIHDVYTSASGTHAAGFFIKRKTGTGVVEVCVDNGATWVDVTTQVDSDSGWHLTQTTLPTVTDPQLGVRLVTSGDAVYLDWAQMDDGKTLVSVHPIEGGATKEVQVFAGADATNMATLITNTSGAIYVESQLLPNDTTNGIAQIFANGVRILYSTNGSLLATDGTNSRTMPLGLIGYSKSVFYWGGSVMQITSNTSSSSTSTYDGAFGTGALYIGSYNAGGSGGFNGVISKIIFYPRDPKTQAEWETIT